MTLIVMTIPITTKNGNDKQTVTMATNNGNDRSKQQS